MKHFRVAKRYGLALFNTARDSSILDTINKDIHTFRAVLESSTDLRAVFKSPVIQGWRKKDILKEIFGTSLNELTVSFINVLCDKGREDIVTEIFDQFDDLYNKHNNLLPITVTSAVAMSDDEKQKLVANIKAKFGATPVATYSLNPELKGGLLVQVGDVLFDTSLRTQLLKLRNSLVSGQSLN
ncbi:MAG: ATP synthase F1 subunit delta [Candidatus Kapabacteria bacterium]|nr:ATP synthase F1 subunit delta [Candidatus Kapabacteria bacterium]